MIVLRLGCCDEAANDDFGPILARIDAWLIEVIGIEVTALPVSAPTDPRESLALQLAWRVLLLGQAARAGGTEPVFEPGRPLALLRPGIIGSPRDLVVRASVPAPVPVSVTSLEGIYLRCAEIIGTLGRTAIGPQGRRQVLADLAALATQVNRQTGALASSTLQVLKAACSLDVPFLHLGDGTFQLGWGARSIRVERSVTAGDSATGARLSQNKASTCALLAKAGLPVPVHQLVRTMEEATSAAESLGWPVVVKPANRDRGEGVTIGVESMESLQVAFKVARRLSGQILVERQVAGVCHRIFVARGKVLYAVRRDPKSVFGDGCRSVASLIEAANLANLGQPSWDRVEPWPADELARQTLATQGLAMDSVPERGRKIALRPIESSRWGGDDEDMSGSIHPENARLAVEAARLIGLDNAGIDLMTIDIAQAWHRNGAVINEVNFAPSLGTAEISRRHVRSFVRRHFEGDGRIPVYAIVGEAQQGLRRALELQRQLTLQGQRCWITGATTTVNATGETHHLTAAGLFGRVQALLLHSSVDALVMMIEDHALLACGLPVDRITDRLEVGHLAASNQAGQASTAHQRLLRLIDSYRRDPRSREPPTR